MCKKKLCIYSKPVELPAFIISAVLSAIAGGAWTATTLEPKARKLLEEAQKIFTGQGAQIKEKIARFTPLGNINTAIATQLVEVEKKYLQ